MSDRRFDRPRRADTETPEPLPRPAPPALPRPEPLTEDERELGRRRVRELLANRFGRKTA